MAAALAAVFFYWPEGRQQLEEAFELAQAQLQVHLPWLRPVAVPVAPWLGLVGAKGRSQVVNDEAEIAASEL